MEGSPKLSNKIRRMPNCSSREELLGATDTTIVEKMQPICALRFQIFLMRLTSILSTARRFSNELEIGRSGEC